MKEQNIVLNSDLSDTWRALVRSWKLMLEKGDVSNRITMPHAARRLTGFEANGNMKAVVIVRVASNGVRRRVAAPSIAHAEVAELADALHSGCSARQGVEVRVLSSAPGLRPLKLLMQFRQPAILE